MINTKDKINDLKGLVAFLNDGSFMDQRYRAGILDTIAIIEGYNNHLSEIVKNWKESKESHKK